MTLQGFDAEFKDLDHYICVITDRIWEGRRLDDIRRYYRDDCAVETPSSVSIGIEPVITGTLATLAAFPDRRLLKEDIVISGDARGGFLSSHRIASLMTHAGDGPFGPASHRPVFARTIADCVCIDNQIVHEWLVRDQAAIARQTGQHERTVAQRWLNERGGFNKPDMPPAPAPYQSVVDTHPAADACAEQLQQLWSSPCQGAPAGRPTRYHEAAIMAVPGGAVCVGATAILAFWASLRAAFPEAKLSIEHLIANERPGRATTVAMRWRVRGLHNGPGRYGAPTGRPVELLAISHADIEHGRTVREWLLIDDVAVWMQILTAEG